MARDGGASSDGKPETGSPDPDFERRIEALRSQIAKDEAPREIGGRGSSGSASAMAAALRMSSEFIAAVVVGGGLGWLVDHALGTSPWGLIVLLMLGFVAGVLGVMRGAGFMSKAGPPDGR